MNVTSKSSRYRHFASYALAISGINVLVGSAVLLGWRFQIEFLKSIVPGFVTMKVNTALCFILAGISLWLLQSQAHHPRKRIGALICGFLVWLIGLLTLLEYIFSLNLRIDELFWQHSADLFATSPPGRMAFVTALIFFLIGIALLHLGIDQNWSIGWAHFIALGTLIIPFIGLVGYLYNLQPLYQIVPFATMAIHTAATATLCCLGLLMTRPEQGLLKTITSPHSGGAMARRLLPFAVLLPLITGWVRLWGQRAGYYDTIFGVVLVVTVLIFSFVVILWFNARALNRIDATRAEVEKSLRESEERFRTLVEQAPESFFVHDQHGKFLDVNERACASLGYTRAELLQMNVLEVEQDFNPALAENIWAQILPGQASTLQGHQRRKDGTIFPVEVHWSCFEYRGQRHFLDLVRDITERQQAEAELSESKTRLAGIISSAMDAIIAVDDEQHITLFNHAAEKMFGCPATIALGLSVEQFIPRRFRAAHQKHIQDFGQTNVSKRSMGQLGAIYGLRANGDEFPIEASISQIEVGGRKLFTIILRDITERQRAELALRQSEEHFRVIFDGAGVGNVECEARTGQFRRVNQRMCEITGYTAEELLTKTFHDITYQQDQDQNFERYQRFINREVPHYFVEKRYVRKNGALVWVQISSTLLCDAAGQPWRTVAVIQDITERKRAEVTQKESEQRFRELAESLPQFIWTCTKDSLCDYLSPQWVAYTGRPAREQLGFGWIDAIHPEDRTPTVTTWQAVAEQGEVLDTEFRIRRYDGSYRWFRTRAVPTFDEKGRLRRWFGSNTDIDDLKRAEAGIRQLNAELEQRVALRTQELAAANRELEAFSYSVSHDLRAPLRAIDGFSRILSEEYGTKLSAEACDYLQIVRDNTQQMGRLIDDLLNFSRLNRQSLTKQIIAPENIVRQSLAELQPLYTNRNLEITIGKLPECAADQILLKQVFMNLLGNALKFTSQRDVAQIRIDALPAEPSNGAVVYFVQDNGVGFDMKYAHKLFQVFQRLHRAEDYEGTGVGLAIVQRIINRHGGRIWADGALNQGATFYFTLEGGFLYDDSGCRDIASRRQSE